MFKWLLKKIVGSRNERVLRQLGKVVQKINGLEADLQSLSDEQLQAKTTEFKERLAKGETLDALLPEAFAVVREASQRVLGLRHFDVQMIGGMVLHHGKIAEMRTGEGKTLMSTLPSYLNALTGHSVHLITVNDYLAKRDAEWMQPIYEFLGLTVGVIESMMGYDGKKAAYDCDIVYGTNNEFGFDYLRDNMAYDKDGQVQGKLNFAVIDEVDSILIDEARTPLIISGPSEESSDLYVKIDKIIPSLKRAEEEEGEGDYYIDEKSKQAFLTEQGHETAERLLAEVGLLLEGESLYHAKNIALNAHLNAAIRGHALFTRDVDYIVRNNEVVIVDEHTGRTMDGRRWSEGLHQAVEAKEGVEIQSENQTLASITFQNYFRLYEKLGGMTGTADTEAYEFQQIYNLEVIVIPTNEPMVRKDHGDQVFLTKVEKYDAMVKEIQAAREAQQPVLLGTASIETSEYLSDLLNKHNIPHNVLNAKMHAKEAEVIADAGRPGTVTIATNMAGRGTDIVLGGNLKADIAALGDAATPEKIESLTAAWEKTHEQVLASGGLLIVGSERHESRRIDNQLRGRSGRQGDPGASRFYLSLEDDLMRIFAAERMSNMMKRLGMGKGEPIEHPWVTKVIENAQRKVEGHNFDIRKQLLEFDDVANDQRHVIYGQRNEVMQAENIEEYAQVLRDDVINHCINQFIPPESMEDEWDVEGLQRELSQRFNVSLDLTHQMESNEHFHEETLREKIVTAVNEHYSAKVEKWGPEVMRHLEKSIFLQVLDAQWKEHLSDMDYLRQGINLRSYAQKDPRQEYKREAFQLFSDMLDRIKYEIISMLSVVELKMAEDVDALDQQRREQAARQPMAFEHPSMVAPPPSPELQMGVAGEAAAPVQAAEMFVRQGPKLGRNEACHCGSGKKFKHCHGKVTA